MYSFKTSIHMRFLSKRHLTKPHTAEAILEFSPGGGWPRSRRTLWPSRIHRLEAPPSPWQQHSAPPAAGAVLQISIHSPYVAISQIYTRPTPNSKPSGEHFHSSTNTSQLDEHFHSSTNTLRFHFSYQSYDSGLKFWNILCIIDFALSTNTGFSVLKMMTSR